MFVSMIILTFRAFRNNYNVCNNFDYRLALPKVSPFKRTPTLKDPGILLDDNFFSYFRIRV